MKIAIFGTGGAGGYFGAQLAMAGEEVVFIARGSHLQAIQEHGLILETDSGKSTMKARATDNPGTVGVVDVILLGVKTWQVQDSARAMLPMIGADTYVVPLQNGVEAAHEIAMIIGAERVLDGLCGTITRILAPGHLRSVGQTNFIRFGEVDNTVSPRVARLRDVFLNAAVHAEIPADIRAAVWKKFAFSAGCGGVGAASRSPAGLIRSVPETRNLIRRCITEVVKVGQAMGVQLDDQVVEDTLVFLDSLAYESTPSLLRDIVSGKPSELEAWTGAVVRLGRDASVATPVNDTIYAALLPQELKARE